MRIRTCQDNNLSVDAQKGEISWIFRVQAVHLTDPCFGTIFSGTKRPWLHAEHTKTIYTYKVRTDI